jgi:glycosyltransferase involved in cell wall biosynthesis
MISEEQPLVSVVTLVYNGEAYLRECIESVLAQTYTHWDYTIINNCSTDGSLDIAREYAAKDPRIRIHCNETFLKVIENHNVAFRQISNQSKYCKVVYADDWIFSECLEKMVRLAEGHPSVAIVGAYALVGTNVRWYGLPYPSTVSRGREVCRSQLLGELYVLGNPNSVLYRSDIVRSRHAFFNESNLHADTEACLEFLEHHDFGFVHQVLTFTRLREDSMRSYSERVNTHLPGNLYNLVHYGSKYLSEKELMSQIRKCLRDYYHYLGEQVYKRRGQEFWSFHRGKLADLGYPLSTYRLAAAAMSYALDIALNPKANVEKAVRRIMSRLLR